MHGEDTTYKHPTECESMIINEWLFFTLMNV